ncbi:HPP family protein [Undibacterium flavidum]|nr:HPP family protein [Undibacterium flavidum]
MLETNIPTLPATAPRHSLRNGVVACVGVFSIIGILSYCSFQLGVLLALGSFGSSAVLLFTFPENHFSQPRSLVGGHFICTLVALLVLSFAGHHWWALAIAVALATAIMMLTRTLHPPAGSNPIIVFLAMPDWQFLFFPTLFGAMMMVLVAWFYHRACRRSYPLYWI